MKKWFTNIRHGMHIMLGLVLLAGASAASAQKTCTFNTGGTGAKQAVSLTRALDSSAATVGRDWFVGFPIYAGVVQTGPFAITCTGASAIAKIELSTTSTPYPLMVPQPTGGGVEPAVAGKVYATGITGVGVYVAFSAFESDPNSGIVANGSYDWNIGTGTRNYNQPTSFEVRLIKTGPVTPGSLTGANLPRVQLKIGGLKLLDLGFSGNFSIVSQTCTTGTEPVTLGDYPASTFTGQGTGSPLKDFVINLKNCPAFYGKPTVGGQYASLPSTTVTPISGIGGITKNSIGASFTPPAADIAAPGTLKLSSPALGKNKAQNIGIEIRVRGASTPIAFNQTTLTEMPLTTAAGNYTLPFSARYVQLASGTVVPGQANGSVEYTLSYY